MSWIEEISTRLVNTNQFKALSELEISKPMINYLELYESESNFDPYKIIQSILQLAGFRIIENNEIRKILIKSLSKTELMHLSESIEISNTENMNSLIELISSIRWKWNDLKCKKIAEILKISDIFFEHDNAILPADSEIKDSIIKKNYDIKNFFELHSFQYTVRDEVIERFAKYRDSKVLLQLPTGAGKTRTAIHTVIQYLKLFNVQGNILWLSYSPLLLNQAEGTFKEIWPVLGDNDLYAYHNLMDYLPNYFSNEKSILFSSIITLSNQLPKDKLELSKLSKSFSFVIFDEAHQSIANLAIELIKKLNFNNPNIKILGLTATPGRGSGIPREIRTFVNFFDTKVKIKVPNYGLSIVDEDLLATEDDDKTAIKYLQDVGVLAKLKHEIISFDSNKKNKDLGLIPERNKLIIDKIMEYVFQSKKIIVFACSVEHAKILGQILKIKNINVGLILADTPDYTRLEYIEKFRKSKELNVLINLEVLTTGFDAPEVDAILITRPINSPIEFSQILGRGLRGKRNGGHEENTIISISNPAFSDEHQVYKYFDIYWEK